MPRRISLLLALALISATLTSAIAPARAAGALDPPVPADGPIQAGYGEADATWHVGAGAGQYSEKDVEDPEGKFTSVTEGDVDPHGHSIAQKDSYGVQSRLSYRALVVEDSLGDQVAFVKSDSYLAQDYLLRRAGQILLVAGSQISFEEMFHMASHNHSSPYYMTPAPGPWIFQDAFDIRAFEYHARALAQAVMNAEAALKPARMGATTVEHNLFKGMIQRKGISDDGTPRGYPNDFGDLNLPVLRFDNIEDPNNPQPIATLINWGQHPEGLDDHDLITGDYVASLERFVERATGAPLVFGQGDVGSAEAGPGRPDLVAAEGIPARWSHAGHAQAERGGYLLARDVIAGYNQIAEGDPLIPFSSTFDVAAGNAWVAGPYSHPYPSVSNCRTETAVEGHPVTPGAPECITDAPPLYSQPELWETLKQNGIPLPDNYDLPSFVALEENTRLHLQAFKLGDVIIASCACESQVDLILNFESRANDVAGDQWDGFDWTTRMDCSQNADTTWTCRKKANEPRPNAVLDPFTVSDYRYRRMLAQIHNPADGWDAPENINKALSEPYEPAEIFGNFSSYELAPETGYKLAIGVGHASDYNGYTVSYREYQSWDDYRKSLTSYGPHTADYMVTRMVRLAGTLNGVPSLELQADVARGLPDEGRQLAMSGGLGAASLAVYEAWIAALPIDIVPADPIVAQPNDIEKFNAATFSWYGGSNAIDNPNVIVERFDTEKNDWVEFADQSGEIQTKLDFPNGVNAFADTYSGQQTWQWTANFEAFDSFPVEIGSTPPGEYRFVVDGKYRSLPSADTLPDRDTNYHLESAPFTVAPWDGIEVGELVTAEDGSVSFADPTVTYPKTYTSVFPYVNGEKKNDDLGKEFCTRCSFRPWAAGSKVVGASVTVTEADGDVREVPATKGEDGRWHADTNLYRGDTAFVEAGGVRDENGETNGTRSATVTSDREPNETVVATTLEFTAASATSGQFSDAVRFQARLTGNDGAPITGQVLEFEISGGRTFQATTGADGVATVDTTLTETPGSYYIWARFGGEANVYEPSSAAPMGFVVDREDTQTSLTSSGKGSKLRLTAVLTEDGFPLEGKTIDFFAGDTLIASVVTDGSGRASTDVPSRYRGNNQQYRASYSGDDFYRPSSGDLYGPSPSGAV